MSTQAQDENKDSAPNAYLLVQNQIFSLEQSVTNIGRKLGNHLVIDDMRVSRTHALIRFIHNQFYIVDLKSMGGTYVNGERIDQSMLFPGDTISLAGFIINFVMKTGTLVDKTEGYTNPHEIDVEDEENTMLKGKENL